MAEKTINGKIKQRYDTSANWASKNPILLAGELGIESDTNKVKYGNGITVWNNLDYANANDPTKEPLIKNVVTKTSIVDADTLPISDSTTSGATKKVTFAVIKATLKTYFDTLYNKYVLPVATSSSLGGVKSGTAITVDGSGNVSVISNSHYHDSSTVNRSPSTNSAGELSVLDQPMIDYARACRTAFTPSEAIKIEYSIDGGSTWVDYGASNSQKIGIFSMNRAWSVKVGAPSSTNITTSMQTRITIEPIDRYAYVDQFYCWFSSNWHTSIMDIERSTVGAKDTFSKIRSDVQISGWSGNNIVNFPGSTYGGGSTQLSNSYAYRFTFKIKTVNNSHLESFPTVTDIRLYGVNVWAASNKMMEKDSIYSWDSYQNVTFPSDVKANTFTGKLNGDADTVDSKHASDFATAAQGIKADTAVQDSSYVHTDNNYTTADKTKLNGIATGANNYSLPKASTTVLGGIKVGENLSVDADGVLSAQAGAASKDIPGYNLLDNSDFSNPVNQRGKTGYAAAGHTVDRWLKDAAGGVTVSDGKIILTRSDATSAHFFYQRVPKEKVKSGNTYTLSVGLANGTVYTLTAVLSNTVAEKITPFGRVTFVMRTEFAQVLIDYGKDSLELAFVKFEESPFPTPYVPKGYGVELAECQRYARVAFISIGAQRSINTMLNYDMRIVPTFAVLNQIAGTFYPVFSNVTKQSCEVSIPNPAANYWVGTYFLSADL